MDYATAVELAPPGWRHFTIHDVDRLPPAVRRHELARVPPNEPAERVVRALFWTLVYHLEPQRWDELASVEPIHPGLLDALPRDLEIAIDVGAGSGRLTQHICGRARRVVAVEPSIPLAVMLMRRLPSVGVLAGWAEALPLPTDFAQLTAACGAFGPDPGVLAELERVTVSGGAIALINPEQPEWFEANGWKRTTFAPVQAAPHAARIDEFFGRPDPPRDLVTMRV